MKILNGSRKSPRKQESGKAACSIQWAGQAGFFINTGTASFAIDLYLSDYLARKYAGKELPHRRLAGPPIAPEDVAGIDIYLCSHGHSDHMDPETFPVVMKNNPRCRAVVPAALAVRAAELGVDRGRIIAADAGKTLQFPELGIEIRAVAAAHEELTTDEQGRHLFLGYCISTGGIRIYHSGDCVPYEGLTETVKELAPDTALLPINGRDDYRRERNIAGNFTFEEAVELCRKTGIPRLLPHHFGMFDFNTADVARVKNRIEADRGMPPEIILPELGKTYPCVTL